MSFWIEKNSLVSWIITGHIAFSTIDTHILCKKNKFDISDSVRFFKNDEKHVVQLLRVKSSMVNHVFWFLKRISIKIHDLYRLHWLTVNERGPRPWDGVYSYNTMCCILTHATSFQIPFASSEHYCPKKRFKGFVI